MYRLSVYYAIMSLNKSHVLINACLIQKPGGARALFLLPPVISQTLSDLHAQAFVHYIKARKYLQVL